MDYKKVLTLFRHMFFLFLLDYYLLKDKLYVDGGEPYFPVLVPPGISETDAYNTSPFQTLEFKQYWYFRFENSGYFDLLIMIGLSSWRLKPSLYAVLGLGVYLESTDGLLVLFDLPMYSPEVKAFLGTLSEHFGIIFSVVALPVAVCVISLRRRAWQEIGEALLGTGRRRLLERCCVAAVGVKIVHAVLYNKDLCMRNAFEVVNEARFWIAFWEGVVMFVVLEALELRDHGIPFVAGHMTVLAVAIGFGVGIKSLHVLFSLFYVDGFHIGMTSPWVPLRILACFTCIGMCVVEFAKLIHEDHNPITANISNFVFAIQNLHINGSYLMLCRIFIQPILTAIRLFLFLRLGCLIWCRASVVSSQDLLFLVLYFCSDSLISLTGTVSLVYLLIKRVRKNVFKSLLVLAQLLYLFPFLCFGRYPDMLPIYYLLPCMVYSTFSKPRHVFESVNFSFRVGNSGMWNVKVLLKSVIFVVMYGVMFCWLSMLNHFSLGYTTRLLFIAVPSILLHNICLILLGFVILAKNLEKHILERWSHTLCAIMLSWKLCIWVSNLTMMLYSEGLKSAYGHHATLWFSYVLYGLFIWITMMHIKEAYAGWKRCTLVDKMLHDYPVATVEELAELDDVCGICHEEFHENGRKTFCGHIFHPHCFSDYVLAQRDNDVLCPYCRRNL